MQLIMYITQFPSTYSIPCIKAIFISCLMNTLTSPLFLQTVRPVAQAGNKNLELSPLTLFAFFVARCRENLHIVVAFSPIGDAFRNRLRQFPSLINCCTIDWFQVLYRHLEWRDRLYFVFYLK